MILTQNGNDISSEVVSIQRTQNICSGVGSLSISLKRTLNIFPYDVFVYYEDSIKKGTYFASDKNDDLTSLTIQLQDITKLLSDYFISDMYEITTPTTSRYWIEKFLTEAQVAYNFNTASQGHDMSINAWVGNDYLLTTVQNLCVENGWYYYADADNVLQIGSLEVDLEQVSAFLNDEDILTLQKSKDDKMLRNRVIMRGNADPINRVWVNAEVKVITPWNYDSNDYRTTMISSPNIYDEYDALHLANMLLNETKKITEITTITLPGFYDLHLGDIVYVNSMGKIGLGRITNIGSTNISSGNTTELVLDQRCPRMFGYYDTIGNIYAGTWGDGVWKKALLYVHTWSNFSDGILSGELNISSLHVANGNFACVGNEQLYIRNSSTDSWEKKTFDGYNCTDCTVDRLTGDTYALLVPSGDYTVGSGILTDDVRVLGTVLDNTSTLLYKLCSSGELTTPISISGIDEFFGWNLDHDEKNLYIGGVIPSGTVADGKVWDDFTSPPVTYFSYDDYSGQQYGSFDGRGLNFTYPDTSIPIPPKPHTEYYQASTYEFPIDGGIPEVGMLKGQWVLQLPGVILRSESKLKIVAEKYRQPDGLYFQLYTNNIWPEDPTYRECDFNFGSMYFIPGVSSREDIIGPRYMEGDILTRSGTDPTGIEVTAVVWNIYEYPSLPSAPHQLQEAIVSSIEFENVDFVDTPNPSGRKYYMGNRNVIVKYDGNTFTILLDNISTPRKIETSQDVPILDFDNNVLDYIDQVNGHYGPINSSGVLTDARVVQELTLNGRKNRIYYTLTEERKTNLYVGDHGEEVDFGGYYRIDGTKTNITFSGIDAKLESSNNYDDPFMLISTFTDAPHFYQKDGGKIQKVAREYEEHSDNLPDSRITVIRLDDRI